MARWDNGPYLAWALPDRHRSSASSFITPVTRAKSPSGARGSSGMGLSTSAFVKPGATSPAVALTVHQEGPRDPPCATGRCVVGPLRGVAGLGEPALPTEGEPALPAVAPGSEVTFGAATGGARSSFRLPGGTSRRSGRRLTT